MQNTTDAKRCIDQSIRWDYSRPAGGALSRIAQLTDTLAVPQFKVSSCLKLTELNIFALTRSRTPTSPAPLANQMETWLSKVEQFPTSVTAIPLT